MCTLTYIRLRYIVVYYILITYSFLIFILLKFRLFIDVFGVISRRLCDQLQVSLSLKVFKSKNVDKGQGDTKVKADVVAEE